MATNKTPPPYDGDFDELRFGEWTWRKGEHSLMPHSPSPGMDAAYHNKLKAILDKNQYQAKVLLGWQGKFVYEGIYQGVAGKNKAKIVFPLSTVSGLSIDEAKHTITFVLSSPPLSYLGLQKAEQLPGKPMPTKTRTKWDKEPTDFTHGAIKRAVAHTVRVSGSVKGFKNRLLSVPRMAFLAQQGLPQGVLYQQFSQEQLAPPHGKRAGGRGAAIGAADPKRLKPAAPESKKLKAALQAGLVGSLPATAGPWMLRCVKKWGLLAPFDPAVTETQWEAYYKERAALEWHSNAVADGWLDCCLDPRGIRAQQGGAAGSGAAGDGGEAEKESEDKAAMAEVLERLSWREDFELPTSAMPSFCTAFYGNEGGSTEGEELAEALAFMRRRVQRILQGCKGVTDVEALAKNASSGLFITAYHVSWEIFGEPMTVDMRTRFYSPCGTARCIELETNWHRPMRMSFAEAVSTCKIKVRGPADCRPTTPHAKAPDGVKAQVLYSSDLQNSAYERRTFLGTQDLRKLQDHLLGRRGVMSERKLMSVLAAAGGAGCFGTEADYVDRVNRRKNKLADGEESDHSSSADIDSGNEMLKTQSKSQYSNIYADEAEDELYDSDEENQAAFTNVLAHPAAAPPAALSGACPIPQSTGGTPGLQWGAFAASQEAAKTQAQPWVFPAVHVGPFLPLQHMGLGPPEGSLFSMQQFQQQQQQQQPQPETANPMEGLLIPLQGSFGLLQQQEQPQLEVTPSAGGFFAPQGGIVLDQPQQQPGVVPYWGAAPFAAGMFVPQGGLISQQQPGVASPAGYNFFPQAEPLQQQQQQQTVVASYAGGIFAPQGGFAPQQLLQQREHQRGVGDVAAPPGGSVHALQGGLVPQQQLEMPPQRWRLPMGQWEGISPSQSAASCEVAPPGSSGPSPGVAMEAAAIAKLALIKEYSSSWRIMT